ncbi:unnamed protein product [Cuscuta campestris]|uniref:BHLH domain-containing protein n=1 Tax=Cuscuta campestris TaxID=132261 RepID=A0A484NFB4_9ASTE|nr:unnamed protein product [Cuscuta campestris]
MTPHGLTFHHWAASNNNNKHQLSTAEVEEAAVEAAAAAAQHFYCPTNDNLQALDLLNSEDHSHHHHHHQEFGFQNFGMDHNLSHHQLQPSNHQRPLFCSNSFPDIGGGAGGLSSSNKNGNYPTTTNTKKTVEPKRQNGVEPMPPHAPLIKKSRLDSRASSSPPFKVRKEKLGDRIAALQQLVAPFGKTDTASVLMEAIGYINFLQNQVHTLSFPYMKPSRNHTCNRAIIGGSQEQEDNSGSEETGKMSLRSRGLCLVPLSCLSYIIPDTGGGGGFWPPHTFGGS